MEDLVVGRVICELTKPYIFIDSKAIFSLYHC